jgi:hypothetical protein
VAVGGFGTGFVRGSARLVLVRAKRTHLAVACACCGQLYEVPLEFAGDAVACDCGEVLVVPAFEFPARYVQRGMPWR